MSSIWQNVFKMAICGISLDETFVKMSEWISRASLLFRYRCYKTADLIGCLCIRDGRFSKRIYIIEYWIRTICLCKWGFVSRFKHLWSYTKDRLVFITDRQGRTFLWMLISFYCSTSSKKRYNTHRLLALTPSIFVCWLGFFIGKRSRNC